jgi:RecA-family ATPase
MRNVTLLAGDGGLGKSTLLVQLMTSTSLGLPWLGLPVLKVPALGFFAEDDEDELHRRFAAAAAQLDVKLGGIPDVHPIDRVGEDNALVVFDKAERGTETPLYNSLREEACDLGVRLIALDSSHDLFCGNENSRPQVRIFIGALRRLALDIDGAVVLASHPSLHGLNSGSGTSGSTAWHNAVRSRLYLERESNDKDPDARILQSKKSNYGPSAPNIRLRWEGGAFVTEASSVRKRDEVAEQAFIACMRLAQEQGRPASASKTSTYYGPKLFLGMPAASGLPRVRLERAMESLFARGDIPDCVARVNAARDIFAALPGSAVLPKPHERLRRGLRGPPGAHSGVRGLGVADRFSD